MTWDPRWSDEPKPYPLDFADADVIVAPVVKSRDIHVAQTPRRVFRQIPTPRFDGVSPSSVAEEHRQAFARCRMEELQHLSPNFCRLDQGQLE